VKECACKEEGSMWARASIAVALHRVESTELSQVKSSRVESSRAGSSLRVNGETAVADRDIARRLNG